PNGRDDGVREVTGISLDLVSLEVETTATMEVEFQDVKTVVGAREVRHDGVLIGSSAPLSELTDHEGTEIRMGTVSGIEIIGDLPAGAEEVVTDSALELIVTLHRALAARRIEALAARAEVVAKVAAGGTLDFLPETEHIRNDPDWQVAPPAPGLEDRRVEITGPTDRRMTINALNAGAKVWLADQEDANTPEWDSVVGGQLNLLHAINRTIDFTRADGKRYELKPDEELATIVMRPRGWHLPEKHILVDGEETSGSLVDFALFVATAGLRQIEKGQGPYFYLPKMEHHL